MPNYLYGNQHELRAHYLSRLSQIESLKIIDPVTAYDWAVSLREKVRNKHPDIEGSCLCLMAATLFYQSQYDECLPIYYTALAYAEQHMDDSLRSRSLNGVGNVFSVKAESSSTDSLKHLQCYYESALLSHKLGDEIGWQRSLSNIGLFFCDFDLYDEALLIHRQLYEASLDRQDLYQMSTALANSMIAYAGLKQYCKLSKKANEYLKDTRFLAISQHRLVVLAYYATALLSQGDLLAALKIIGEAEQQNKNAQDIYYGSMILLIKSEIYLELNDKSEALMALQIVDQIITDYAIKNRRALWHNLMSLAVDDTLMAQYHAEQYNFLHNQEQNKLCKQKKSLEFIRSQLLNSIDVPVIKRISLKKRSEFPDQEYLANVIATHYRLHPEQDSEICIIKYEFGDIIEHHIANGFKNGKKLLISKLTHEEMRAIVKELCHQIFQVLPAYSLLGQIKDGEFIAFLRMHSRADYLDAIEYLSQIETLTEINHSTLRNCTIIVNIDIKLTSYSSINDNMLSV